MPLHSSIRPAALARCLTASLLLLVLAVPGLATAEQSPAEIAERYLDHYTSLQFDALAEFYTPQTRVADPAQDSEVVGGEQIVPALTRAFEGVKIHRKTFERRLVSIGGYVVTVGTFAGTSETHKDGKTLVQAFDMPVVIVLKIVDGKVVEHLDYPDYGCASHQAAAQSEGLLAFSELPRCDES